MTFSLSLLLLPNPTLHKLLLKPTFWIAEEPNYGHLDAFNVIREHVQQGSRVSFLKTLVEF